MSAQKRPKVVHYFTGTSSASTPVTTVGSSSTSTGSGTSTVTPPANAANVKGDVPEIPEDAIGLNADGIKNLIDAQGGKVFSITWKNWSGEIETCMAKKPSGSGWSSSVSSYITVKPTNALGDETVGLKNIYMEKIILIKANGQAYFLKADPNGSRRVW